LSNATGPPSGFTSRGLTRFHTPIATPSSATRWRKSKGGAGGYRLSWKSESKPGDPKAGTRIERVWGETRIELAGADACRMTYAYVGDLGGKFPVWAQEKAWREESVQYFRAIRRKLGLPEVPK
jgi:hypothetical protein